MASKVIFVVNESLACCFHLEAKQEKRFNICTFQEKKWATFYMVNFNNFLFFESTL
jgi:hypothetical protein